MAELEVEKQYKLSRILNSILKKQTNVHSYMMYCNDSENLKKYSILMAKILICGGKYEDNCEKCNVCKRIDNNNYLELKIINPIGEIIKKEEIVNLKKEFKTTSIEGRCFVYIINDAELLNPSAANSMLKFLEEPDSNVVGIFTTTNIDGVYETIISRCQLIRLNNEERTNEVLDDDTIEFILTYLEKIEYNITDSMVEIKEKWLKKIIDRQMLKNSLEVFLKFYVCCLNYKLTKKIKKYKSFENLIYKISTQEVEKITKKITFVLENIKKLDYNVNMQIFMVNFVIGIGDLNEN